MKASPATSLALGFASFITLGTNASAAVIATGGSVLDETQWVTQGYGTDGHIFFNNAAATARVAASSSNISTTIGADIEYAKLASHSAGPSGQTGINDNVPIQAPSGTGTLAVGYWRDQGTNSTTYGDLISFEMNNTPTAMRIGVLVGAGGQSDGNTNPRDYPSNIRLSDGTNTFDHTVVRPAPTDAYQADWYFFDVTGITSTTTLTVFATGQSNVSPNLNTPISGVVFAAIPEPSSAALSLLALAGLTLRRRR